MAKRKKPPRKYDAHVRLYRYETESPAYRSLSTDARALLIEMRSLYKGQENRVFMSIRRMMECLSIGQRRAQAARDELLDRGFIVILNPGGFSRKVRHATEYGLTNEPLPGEATARKTYMSWRPAHKNTVAETTTDGSRDSYRPTRTVQDNPCDGSQRSYRKGPKSADHGSRLGYTVSLPRRGGSTALPTSEPATTTGAKVWMKPTWRIIPVAVGG